MSQDRVLGVQRLSPQQQAEGKALELAWVKALSKQAGGWLPSLPWAQKLEPPLSLAMAQAVSESLVLDAWPLAPQPRLRRVGALRRSQAQYLFDVDGGFIQLRPELLDSGPAALASLAHESYHHVQQALVSSLYRGSPLLPDALHAIAMWLRDARAAYRPCPEDPEGHHGQGLELGATAYAQAIAKWRPECHSQTELD